MVFVVMLVVSTLGVSEHILPEQRQKTEKFNFCSVYFPFYPISNHL